jgi:DNA mismatch repair ATPase MutL
MQRIALAHDGVGFVATHDGRRVFDVEPAMDLRARVRRTSARSSPTRSSRSTQRRHDALDGLRRAAAFARATATRQMWFLNGRPVRDKVLCALR